MAIDFQMCSIYWVSGATQNIAILPMWENVSNQFNEFNSSDGGMHLKVSPGRKYMANGIFTFYMNGSVRSMAIIVFIICSIYNRANCRHFRIEIVFHSHVYRWGQKWYDINTMILQRSLFRAHINYIHLLRKDIADIAKAASKTRSQ